MHNYTNYDYIKATQPAWVTLGLQCEQLDDYEYTDEDYYKAISTCLDDFDFNKDRYESVTEKKAIENWYREYGEYEKMAYEQAHREMEEEKDGYMSPEERDWRFDNLIENKVPGGWFGYDEDYWSEI